jgi:hypothetical protein
MPCLSSSDACGNRNSLVPDPLTFRLVHNRRSKSVLVPTATRDFADENTDEGQNRNENEAGVVFLPTVSRAPAISAVAPGIFCQRRQQNPAETGKMARGTPTARQTRT